MRNRCRRCCCMNNNYMNLDLNDKCKKSDVLENACDNIVSPLTQYNNNCSCGFDDDNYDDVFPENPMLGQSYVPVQTMNETFKPCKGLKCGTIFPELVSPYSPGDSMKQNAFIESTNTIGEGCNANGRR